jgi:hypothetical protein
MVSLDDDPPVFDPARLDDWTYYRTCNVQVDVVLELETIRQMVELDEESQIAFVVIWSCPQTGLRDASPAHPLQSNEASLKIAVPGGLLRGDLRLDCLLLLMEDIPKTRRRELSPFKAGSILWSMEHTVRLEGIGARMPIQATSFVDLLHGQSINGLWHFTIDTSDLAVPVDAAVRVLLNSDNSMIQEFLDDP